MSVVDTYRLDGKVAIVTGASSVLGAGLARALADAGADVVLGARHKAQLADVAADVLATGRRALAVQTDVSEPEDCTALAAAAAEAFGRVDVLVNNSGVGRTVPALCASADFRPVADVDPRIVDVDFMGAYWMAQECARVMRPGSSIINVASVLGLMQVFAPQSDHTASKAGVIGLTRNLAQQWTARRGIRVNAVAPGLHSGERPGESPKRSPCRTVPLGRMNQQPELDSSIVFLASAASSHITGVTLPVDAVTTGF
ncbi:SDR family NAD(P)-dependent oxidoreductase [Saccharopolyspora phatthalungensis]|uniref:NAD(P)-dependent dehydrogenase (Short-subunit alcohol dehydrogenase family) n=1 Tax=Saccharopolyspora phatthalungensis TaxID=664693 RepID=A0A840QHZ7_9PSEU|nr:SDR family oxidoreductase [Saccharopolyspora phatthalungensis]MBB5159837.1 NAD(P)-dependent dehydrogenase (short-subunit alcohol dehydrogenase family) [Saccharopolyspora phatthalungensis]